VLEAAGERIVLDQMLRRFTLSDIDLPFRAAEEMDQRSWTCQFRYWNSVNLRRAVGAVLAGHLP